MADENTVDNGVQETQSPNENYQDNPNLDANGNPVENPPPAEEKPKGETEQAPKPEPTEEVKLDKSVLSQVEGLLKDAGLSPSEVATVVTKENGEITPDILKALADKHGDAVASLVADKLQGFHEQTKTEANKRDKAVFDQVQEAFKGITEQSGEESWKELSAWAKENVPNAERKEINALLKQGGKAAQYAVQDLISQFKNSDTYEQPAELLDGDSLGDDTFGGGKPLDKAGYDRELRKLLNEGHVYGQSPEIAALDRRRLKAINRGI